MNTLIDQLGSHRLSVHESGRRRLLVHEDGGFSTVGMVLALLITISLVLSSAQVYQIQSKAGQIQDVADAAALSAENVVAEFYIASQTCDAIVLSLSLSSLVCFGSGVVALCVPAAQPLGAKLIDAGKSIAKGRDSFAQKAADGLNAVQKLLPFIAAASAASVTSANNVDGRSSYFGFAVLLPTEGQTISVGALDSVHDLEQNIDEKKDSVSQEAQQAEEAAARANETKRIAFMADCGSNPAYCMYERASKLAGMPPSENPLYESVDAWSFSVALKRAQAYYPARLQQEGPDSGSVEDRARSALRERFYSYACEQMTHAYVRDDATGDFDAYFPLLPRNTTQMKETSLYDEVVYPVSSTEEGILHAHAYGACPQAAEETGAGTTSIRGAEAAGFEECPQCQFSATALGSVAAASTSIQNGFEHHYVIVAQAARDYQRDRAEYKKHADAVKNDAGSLLSQCTQVMAEAANKRIQAFPPGRSGAVAIVADVSGVPASSSLLTSFVKGDSSLGTRAALSGASLVDDQASEAQSVLTDILSGFQDAVPAAEVPQVVIGLWNKMLFAYGSGQETLQQALADTLNSLPLVGQSGLGTWASSTLSSAIESVGLQPAQLSAPKPVVVNSAHVLKNGQCDFADMLLSVKQEYIRMPGSGTGSPFSAALSALRETLSGGMQQIREKVLVVRLEPFGNSGPSIPLEISLPPAVVDGANAGLMSFIDELGGIEQQVTGVRRWE